jgi:Fe-S cluster assembly protein SufB
MSEPEWAYLKFPQIDYQDISIIQLKVAKKIKRLKEVDPELLKHLKN